MHSNSIPPSSVEEMDAHPSVGGADAQRAATSPASFTQHVYRYNFGVLQITAGQGQRSGVALHGTTPCCSSGSNAVDQKRWELIKDMGTTAAT